MMQQDEDNPPFIQRCIIGNRELRYPFAPPPLLPPRRQPFMVFNLATNRRLPGGFHPSPHLLPPPPPPEE